mmetsp:Transcript_41078/g.45788  ORF Transcript_41078/g.45788 Transcript_41078/m.45788 type:complete len:86 (+) Transcript_41078:52-309(+)
MRLDKIKSIQTSPNTPTPPKSSLSSSSSSSSSYTVAHASTSTSQHQQNQHLRPPTNQTLATIKMLGVPTRFYRTKGALCFSNHFI